MAVSQTKGQVHKANGLNIGGRSDVLLLILWVCSAVFLFFGLTHPIVEIAVNVSGVLRDAIDRQPIIGLLLQEKGLNLSDLAAKLPPTSVTRKSIVSSVGALYQLDAYSAATLILLFSVITPIAKQVSLLLVVLFPDQSVKLGTITQAIHKWAMLDVFVLAMIVLTLSSATAWNATLLDGFYWFLGYFFSAGALGLLLSRRRHRSASPTTNSRMSEAFQQR